MITSIEIAKLLGAKSSKKKVRNGFDSALEGLGVHTKAKKAKSKSV